MPILTSKTSPKKPRQSKYQSMEYVCSYCIIIVNTVRGENMLKNPNFLILIIFLATLTVRIVYNNPPIIFMTG